MGKDFIGQEEQQKAKRKLEGDDSEMRNYSSKIYETEATVLHRIS
jgi:hypothetical protein